MLNYLIFAMVNFFLLLVVSLVGICGLFLAVTVDGGKGDGSNQCHAYECKQPTVSDPNLKVELFYQGIGAASSMTFLNDDILLLDKDNGTVNRIVNGSLVDGPLLDANVANKKERGMLGIAVPSTGNDGGKYVYLYYTESKHGDGTDICSLNEIGLLICKPGAEPVGNRLYKYELSGSKLVNPKVLLNLPTTPGPAHNGGAIQIGPDNNIYVTIGDLNNKNTPMKVQNFQQGTDPDGRGGILRVTQDGKTVGDGILGLDDPLNKYYGYGIRNSFGIDFDPLTGNLWDTENGPDYGDEINLVQPGFNSGWKVVQGIWKPIVPPEGDYAAGKKLSDPNGLLVNFEGKGHYRSPEFIWKVPVGPTGIKFLNSDKLGKKYENDLFVGCANLGTIFHFDLNENRTKLNLNNVLADKIANNNDELNDVIFARGLGEVTDIDVGPDGYMYTLSNYMDKVTIFRIVPINN